MTSPAAPVAYRNGQSGQESYSSGLIIHRGPLTAALVRAIGAPATGQAVFPRDGEGSGSSMELGHYPKQQSFIQSYDRDKSQWLPLYLNASVIGLNTQTGMPVQMPQGSAQAWLGGYYGVSGWTVPAINQWYESSVQVSVTTTITSGTTLRVEGYGTLVLNTVGAFCHIGIGIDGNLVAHLNTVQCFSGGSLCAYSFATYMGAPAVAGPHRVSLFLNFNAGSVGFWTGCYQGFNITEQRA